jgi:DNA-binding PadR family transcriptional regulator
MHAGDAWDQPGEEEDWRHHRGGHGGHGRGPGGRGRSRFPGMPGFPGGPGFARGFGDFGPWMGGPKPMRGPRVRRGNVRAAAIALLAEEPMNGYQIIQEIGERSGGVWRPSPGSIYPALQQMEDEGLIRAEVGEGGRRAYELTDEGRAYAAAHQEELRAPWDVVAGSVGSEAIKMRRLLHQVLAAAIQVAEAGSMSQVEQAHQILADTRRRLYGILAADDTDDDDGAKGEPRDHEPAGGQD